MKRRSTILLLIPHLGGGGAERVIALLASGLNRERFDVHLGLVTQRDASGFAIPSHVTVHGMGARRVRTGWWSLLSLVRRIKPDAVLSGMAHLNLLVLALRPLFPRRTRVLIRQNGCVMAGDSLSAHRTLYPRADAVVCQTRAMAADLARVTGLDRKLRVLPNPVDVDAIRSAVKKAPKLWRGPGPHLLAVGRLAPEKGFDLLLHAFAQVRERFPLADLTIVGEGRQKPAIEMLSAMLGLQLAVTLAGHADVPATWFPGTTVFVLPSRQEALSNALLEAAAAGLPLVSAPASQGLAELLRDKPGVWLANEVSAHSIANALESALEQVGAESRFAHDWINAFRKDRAIAAYECLLDECLTETVP